ncbi:hydroxyacid dehydrogenase, partial [Streptomyces sp. SID11233]|nr:hydroxyacid dehydrogenase [Streptomyces sp. SID11233]
MHHPAPVTDASAAPAPGRRPRALLAMHAGLASKLIDAPTMRRLTELSDLDPSLVVDDFAAPAASAALHEAEVLISCWGCPPLTEEVLALAPRLRVVIHAAGSV